MPPEDGLRERVGRKLTKRKAGPRRISMDMPERLRDGGEDEEDVTAPKDPKSAPQMNQSLFSMVAFASRGNKVDFQSRFDEGSSESESDDGSGDDNAQEDLSTSTILGTDGAVESKAQQSQPKRKEPRLLRNKLLKSMHKVSLGGSKERKRLSLDTNMTRSQILEPRSRQEEASETLWNDVPILSRMVTAEAEMVASESGPAYQKSKDDVIVSTSNVKKSVSLSRRLMDIFGFEEPEEVISEFPCWLLQTVLLQGYLYITQRHICFFGYLPKKASSIVTSGSLMKRGRQSPKYTRYWFQLKGDVLSYYLNPKKPYLPSGNIDLRYAISATLDSLHHDKHHDVTSFLVTTEKRTYMFRADSASSAKEWVKHLQRVIFRSHNAGDSVKISLPVENIIDIEENPVLDFAETVKITVIDNGETYAVDEYFFSFFGFGDNAMSILRLMVENHGVRQTLGVGERSDYEGDSSPRNDSKRHSLSVPRASIDTASAPPIRDSVRATLRPPLSPIGRGISGDRASHDSARSSFDMKRRTSLEVSRASMDRGRRSVSFNRRGDRSPLSPRPQESSESAASNSLSPETESSAAIQSLDDTTASASQILARSDVFHPSTIHRPVRVPSDISSSRSRNASEDTARSARSHKKRYSRSGRSHGTSEPLKRRSKSNKRMVGETEDEREARKDKVQSQGQASTLQNFMRAGAYPLQKASGLAGFVKNRSKHMSSLLASESMGYYEKVSGMWAGGKKHYGAAEGLNPEDDVLDVEDEEDALTHAARFRDHFALPDSERLHATYFGYFHRVLPLYGKIYVSNRHFCYRSLLPGTRTKLILPLKEIETCGKERGYRPGYKALVVTIRGHEELFFDFSAADLRDDCAVTLLQLLSSAKYMQDSGLLDEEEIQEQETAKIEHHLLQEARQDGHAGHELSLPHDVEESEPDAPPIMFDDPRASILNFKPTESLRITCLTIGSRGDVQPYIALCKGLLAEGHKARIATHREFEDWVRSHGIEFSPVEGDPAELMRICVENGMFTYSFMREATSKFRGWVDELLSSAWLACQDSDLLIESPSAMAGIHIAEALRIPYFRAFTMPWTRTRAYPHAFAVPERKMGGTYNYMSYIMFDAVFWKAIASQVNRWRRKELSLGGTSFDKMQPNKVPFLYNFSPSVVVPPIDYSDWVRVTGYWFLDEATNDWKPPTKLQAFVEKARKDGKKLVYVGFGSIVVEDPAALTKTVVDAVVKADVRCILSKGWSDRLGTKDATKPEVPLPSDIHQIKSAPHDWLFKQIDAAAHHGGAGTTGASLRAGIPTIIKPFFGDQFFFGSRVEDLGVGICMKKINTALFARALWEATHSERMVVKARVLGEQIRKEDGVGNAIKAIYRDMDYAKSLIKKRKEQQPEELDDDFEETWTFIGDESDPELKQSIIDWKPPAHLLHGGARTESAPAAMGSQVLH